MNQTKNSLKKFTYSEKLVPLALALLSILAYVPLISKLGFYWDDWPMDWFKVTQGASGFAATFASDRPFLAHLYELTARLLNNNPLEWQIVCVIMRYGVTLAFWWMLKQLWPDHAESVFWMAALLAVYPGYKQMPIAYLWANAFIMLLAYVLSYGMMLKAMRSSSAMNYLLWTVPSALLYTFCTISTEYYTGLDMVRPIIIWIFLAFQTDGFNQLPLMKRIGKTLLHWLPYLAILAAFLFWRVFIFKFPSYQPTLVSELSSQPLKTIGKLIQRIIEDAYTASWGAWTQFFKFPHQSEFSTASGKLFWAFTAAGFVLALLLIRHFHSGHTENAAGEPAEPTKDKGWYVSALVLGLTAVIFPGFPYWVTELKITLTYPTDRFLVAFMFGSCILMTVLIRFFIRSRASQRIIISLFIAMAIGGHILNANSYRRDWNNQREFVNQLQTRMPNVKKGTLFLTDSNALEYETDNSLTGLVNLTLAPKETTLNLPYSVAFYNVRFHSSKAEIESEDNIYQGFRSAMFAGNKNSILVYFYAPPGCLRVLDTKQHASLPIFPTSFYQFMNYSNLSLIQREGEPDTFIQDEIFRQPVQKNWCYYFEKADLARQYEDWNTIAEIGDQVLPTMKAGEASEYIPYIEAYAKLDRWKNVFPLLQKMHQEEPSLDKSLCAIVQNLFNDYIGNKDNPPARDKIDEIVGHMNGFGCSAYTKNF